MNERFEEALAILRREEERVFVAAVLGATQDVMYWNWTYGYTVTSGYKNRSEERRRFTADLGRHRLAAPVLARHRYGTLVTDVSINNPR